MTVYIPTIGEERANAISHGVMALLLLLALPFAAVWSYMHGGMVVATSTSIYLISIFGMMLFSTLYHAMSPNSRHKEVLHVMDHIFIYIAIAGTYTPVALCVVGGWQGELLVVLQWLMVIFGVLYKSLSRRSIPAVSLTIYMVMGWTAVLVFPSLIRNATPTLLLLIFAGGLFYSAGAWIYARKGFRYHHLVWHLFINIALLLHFTAIIFHIY